MAQNTMIVCFFCRNRSVYPEIVYRFGGGFSGLATIPGRINQLCLSFGTCYIAFFPLQPIQDKVLYSSMIFAIIPGLIVFSIRICSVECSFEFLVSSFAWTYSDGKCAQILVEIVFYAVKFQIYSGYFFNFLTFAKICMDTKQKTFIGNSELANRLRRTKIRLAQCVIQDFLFLIDVNLQFGVDFGRNTTNYEIGFVLPFLFNTFFWNMAHGIDGLTMLAMLNVTNKVVRVEHSSS